MNRSSSLVLRPALFLAAVVAAPGAVLPAQRGPLREEPAREPFSCLAFPNGSFDNGLSGWSLEPCSSGFGDVTHLADATVRSATYLGGDEHALYLDVFARVDDVGTKLTGSAAQAQMSVSRPFVVTHRFLELDVRGGYGLCLFGGGTGRLAGTVSVSDASGRRTERSLHDDTVQFQQPCGTGICIAGFLPGGAVSLDLLAAGFRVGQLATVEVVWGATVVSLDACNVGDYGGGLFVDDFRLCDAAASTAPAGPPSARIAIESRSEWEALSWRSLPLEGHARRILEWAALARDRSAGAAVRARPASR